MTEKIWEGWHFLAPDGTVARLGVKAYPGQVLKVPGPIELCHNGLHASRRAIDALGYANSPIVSRVRLSGEIREDNDKAAASERTVLWVMDASIALHITAVNCAQIALDRRLAAGDAVDPRSQAALDVKLRWLKGQASDSELAAARAAARDAAWDAAWDAARAAAWAAARDAAWDAAWDAARDEQNNILEAAIQTQHETGYGVIGSPSLTHEDQR